MGLFSKEVETKPKTLQSENMRWGEFYLIEANAEVMKVHGGWVLRSFITNYQSSALHQLFIADPQHHSTWTIAE